VCDVAVTTIAQIMVAVSDVAFVTFVSADIVATNATDAFLGHVDVGAAAFPFICSYRW
jgi:hypothetical protein